MRCKTFINENHEEEVLIYAKERTSIVTEIEKLCITDNSTILGTLNDRIVKLLPLDISYFTTENNKTYAIVKDERYQIRERLYQLEETYNDIFIKLNQSCYANIKRIKSFSVSIGGALMVTFDNNHTDYISRREVKNVKKRMGL